MLLKRFLNYKKMSTPGPLPKHLMGFSYIYSEDYESDQNCDDTKLKDQSDHTSNDKVIFFANRCSH